MKRLIVLCVVPVCLLFATAAQAGISLYDIDATPGGWLTAVTGMTPMTAYNFGLDADYGLVGIYGPVTSAGAGPISAGTLADGVVMDRVNLGGGDPGLAGIGPSNGWGNGANAIVCNYSVDAFEVLSLPGSPTAFAFNAMNLSGSSVTMTVNGSVVFSGISLGGTGHNFGLVATGGDTISSLRLYDTSYGFEGLQGQGTLYYGQNVVPVPGAFVLGLIGVGCINRIRRRRA